jgi:hypothetical protein
VTDTIVSSPLSTGGAGTFFEQHVAAYWLAQLLVRAVPPIQIGSNVVEVSLQAEHLGWSTDDFLVTCEDAGGVRSRLAGQVKMAFTVSAADDECQKAILDFWSDFWNEQRFSPSTDKLVLVIQRGTNVLLGDLAALLDCARAAQDGADFQRRLTTPGFITRKALHYCNELCSIVGGKEQRTISASELWPFLRVLYVLSLDLNTPTRQTEAQIKVLLAFTASDRGSNSIADSTWNELLVLASEAMANARTLQLADLPEPTRRRHGSLGGDEDRVLRALREHTLPVLGRIKSVIGGVHLERSSLVRSVLDELEESQVVIISGAAGSGKSAIGKAVAQHVGRDHFIFGFRAEEFAQPHIDATLSAAQVPGNAVAVSAILSAQVRRLVLVESIERLLERSTRDAFSDLLDQAAADPEMRILLTCRDYSTELVRASLVQASGLTHGVVVVPSLNDEELAEVARAVPTLGVPLGNERLRSILRNPYFLDKALAMSWSADRPMPESEREFRALFWQQVVRGTTLGSARRREETLQQIAVRRARALSEYVPVGELDPDIVASLLADSLLVAPEGGASVAAIAHDVLEDWAILQWFDELHLADHSFLDLGATIGTHPAIRRSYRKWVTELLEREPATADRLFVAATTEAGVSPQFRDDTLVALLRSPLIAPLLERHVRQIVANGNAVLRQLIRLTRMACVATPDWQRGAQGYGSLMNVPDGPAWPAVLKLAHDNLSGFAEGDWPQLLGLVEDAVRGVTAANPVAVGSQWIAGISYQLLPRLDGYRTNSPRNRLLKVIAKVPGADPKRFEAVLRGAVRSASTRGGRPDRVAEEFQKLIYSGLEGGYAARELPALIAAVAPDFLLLTDEDLRRDGYQNFSSDIDVYFGLNHELRMDSFPASAIRGPWFALLQHHPAVGLELYFKILDHTIDWYTHPRAPRPLEPASRVELTFSDGSVHEQWANRRLWNAYRGTQVSPYVLQSMLMAFERWLLTFARAYPDLLDPLLLKILRGSKSASLSAIVASVAIANVKKAGETLLVLLSVPEFIHLDRERMVLESQAESLSRMFRQGAVENELYQHERQESNRQPQRKLDLEWAIANLQLGPFAPRVYEIIDLHRAALPQSQEADQDSLVWQLSLQRMDLRQYEMGEEVEVTTGENGEAPQSFVRMEPKITNPALKAMIEEGAANHEAMSASVGLWMWGVKAFKGEASKEDLAAWRERLAEGRKRDREPEDEMGGRSGPGVVAVVCIRDHWSEMSGEERDWCTEVACSEVLRTAETWGRMERMQRYDMAADRSSAWVMGRLAIRVRSGPLEGQVKTALAAAITHSLEEVRWLAAWGIDGDVWGADPSIALRCANAVATEAGLIERAMERPRQELWQPGVAEAIYAEAAHEVRRRFWLEDGIAKDAHASLSLDSQTAGDALSRALTIFATAPTESVSVEAFAGAGGALVASWEADRQGGDRRDFESEYVIASRLQQFAMGATPANARRTLEPILGAVDRYDREVHSIIQGLIGLQDRSPRTDQFWYLWGLFADRIKRASWIRSLQRDQDHPTGGGVLATIFLTQNWKDGIRHWSSLEGYAHLVDELPPSWIVLDSYLRFLYHIGERSLPDGFVRIAQSLQRGDARQMLTRSNPVFLLEVLLQRHVYGRPLELKRDPRIRAAVLYLLDVLVDCGSSAAFKMRDDFVTPVA